MTTDEQPTPAASGGLERQLAELLAAIGSDFNDAVLLAADAENGTDVSGLADRLALLSGAVEHAARKVSALVETPGGGEDQADGGGESAAGAVALDPATSRAELRAALLPGLLDRLVTGVWAWESAEPATAPS